MITLPDEGALSRGPLRAFWLATWLVGGASAGALLWSRTRRRLPVCAAVVAAGAGAGLARPELARRPYRAWQRASRRAAEVATRYTTWVTHTTAVPARPTEEFRPHRVLREGGSGWLAAGSQSAAAYSQLDARPRDGRAAMSARRSLREHLREEGHPRRHWLAACLQLLRWLQDPQAPPQPPVDTGENYTLY